MAEVKRITKQTPSKCNCAKPQIFLEFNFPLETEDLAHFTSNGYKRNKSYTDIGICYVEDLDVIVLGAFGSNKLQVKCKNNSCEQGIAKFEQMIRQMR
jgi:hypothetical protein